MGQLIRKAPFQKLLVRINVDEAHFIHTAGIKQHGVDPFRPAWGTLDELQALLPSSIPWHLFSATWPPHIRKTVESKVLRSNYISIEISSNRPNTMYATHEVVDNLANVKNYECFLTTPFDLKKQPHVLIFTDKKELATTISNHLDSCLPLEYQGKDIAMHYHSDMSTEYLQRAHASFTDPNGMCHVLVTTSGQSVGVDFPNVKIVCTAGLPETIVDALQRGGRGIRVLSGDQDADTALFVIFYEPWVHDIRLEDYANGDILDPDRPRKDLTSKTPSVRERAPYYSLMLIRSVICLRILFAEYLGDTFADGELKFITALIRQSQHVWNSIGLYLEVLL